MLTTGSRFWTAVAVLLAALSATQLAAALGDSATWDEGTHIAAGYSYWRTGDYRLNPDHPALGSMLHTLPLLVMDPLLPLYHDSWKRVNDREFGMRFLYYNRLTADDILLACRAVAMFFSVLLGLSLAWWMRRWCGAAAALAAVALYSLDPTVIAIGHYVTNDIAAALFFFLAAACWIEYLGAGRRRFLLLTGLAAGLAVGVKFSSFLLAPGFLAIYVLFRWRGRTPVGLARLALAVAGIAALAALVVSLAYVPELQATVDHWRTGVRAGPYDIPVWDIGPFERTAQGRAYQWLAGKLKLPHYHYIRGFMNQSDYYGRGQPAYLLGQHSERGWWYYFPVAIAVKTPLSVLLLGALAIALVFVRRLWTQALLLAAPPALFLAASMGSGLNVGYRHLLPVFPLAYAALAAAVFELLPRRAALAAGAAVAGLALESWTIAPHHLSFFNAAAGGPMAGPKYLLDSNIDWGQDAKRLGRYQEQQDLDWICAMYFGSAHLWYHGIIALEVPKFDTVKQANCVAAVSVSPLHGLFMPPGAFSELRARKPDGRVGYSIWLYDLRKPQP
jgi:hypothetical protein